MRIGRELWSDATRRAASQVWLPFLLSRVWAALWVYVGHNERPFLQPVRGGYEGVESWWLNPWTTYDSQHFFSIARGGYTTDTIPFFPLYPLLLKLAGPNEVVMALWGVVLSNAAFFAGLVALHRLTTLDHNQRVATLAVWLLAFSPLTCVFSAVYTESVFLLLLVTSFLAARHNRWGWAGALGGLAALTRNSGPLIFVALLLEWRRARRSGTDAVTQGEKKERAASSRCSLTVSSQRRVAASALLPCLLPLLGFLAFQGYIAARFGGLSGVTSHGAYGRAWQAPWLPLWNDFAEALAGRANPTTWLNLSVTLLVFFLLARGWKRQPLAYSALMLGIITMQLAYGRTHPVYTNSSLRFMSTTFPFVQLLALELMPLANSKRLRPVFMLVGALLALLFCAQMSYEFGLKHFVTG